MERYRNSGRSPGRWKTGMIVTLVPILLAGCTPAKLRLVEYQMSWMVGKNISAAVAEWGQPNELASAGEYSVYTWSEAAVDRYDQVVGSENVAGPNGGVVQINTYAPTEQWRYCHRSLYTNSADIIVKVAADGDGCSLT
ncbi:hypothetical protein QFZ27_005826 [Inquilinus ginsengisoli]